MNPWHKFLALPNETPIKAIGMAAVVGFIAAIVVSSSEQLLKPKRLENIAAMEQQRLQSMLARLPGLKDILVSSGVDALDTRLIDLDAGIFNESIDIATYDQQSAATDPTMSIALSAAEDQAGIARRANYAPVFLLHKDKKLVLLVLPVHGTGYQSTIRAWLSLSGDLETVAAFTVFEQAETPGIGARIDDSKWQAKWNGKHVYNDAGTVSLSVNKGPSTSVNTVDGITGATRTGNGISDLLAFWLGDKGFGPFLSNLKGDLL